MFDSGMILSQCLGPGNILGHVTRIKLYYLHNKFRDKFLKKSLIFSKLYGLGTKNPYISFWD